MDRRLKIFFALTFAISWGIPLLFMFASPSVNGRINMAMYSMLYYVGVWGPAVAAIITIAWVDGEDGLLHFGRRIVAWRGPRRWYIFALVAIPSIYVAAAAIAWLIGKPAFSWPDSGGWGLLLVSALGRAIAGPVEEIGWRGYALPLLQQRLSGIAAASVLGVIWAVWHLPLFVNGMAANNFVTFLAQIVAVSIIFTVIFNASAGCIPLMILCHWLTNFPYPWEGDAELLPAQSFVLVVAALAVILVFGKRYLGRENLVNRTPGLDSS